MNYPDLDISIETDMRTNAKVDVVSLDVRGPADLQLLRQRWKSMPSIPKLVASRGDGEDCSWPGFDVRTLLRGEESNGRFSAHSMILSPGAELPAHGHVQGDTYWFVLSGEVDFIIGSKRETLASNGFAFAPEMTTQAIANRAGRPAEVYVFHSPAGADRAFAEAHRLAKASSGGGSDAYRDIFERHGFRFTDGAPLPNDDRVNTDAGRVDGEIGTLHDYEELRGRWAQLPPTPKIITNPQECRNIPVTDQETRVMLTPEESRSAASVFFGGLETGFGAPPHHQPSEEEMFIILDGPLRLNIGNVTTETAGRGAFGFAPRYGTHSFTNLVEKHVQLITMNAPGGHDRGFEFTVEQMGAEDFGEKIAAHGFQFHVPI